MIGLKKAILQTLIYSDLFDYPLTKDEIWRFLISDEKISKQSLEKILALHLRGVSIKKDRFYCFENREEIISKRLGKEEESDKKLELAKKIISKLSIVPTIQFIGISGALAMKNSDKDDDIDLFVIAKKNTLWTTRLLVLFFLQMLGHRRKRTDKKFSNKICLNMFLDESLLSLSKERQDLYTAHEVVQMIPVFERENTYGKFIESNLWVKKYLPNFKRRTNQSRTPACQSLALAGRQNHTESIFNVVLCQVLFPSVVEALARKIQLHSIKKHQTIETVSDTLLAFHPLDYKKRILKMYNKNLKKYEI